MTVVALRPLKLPVMHLARSMPLYSLRFWFHGSWCSKRAYGSATSSFFRLQSSSRYCRLSGEHGSTFLRAGKVAALSHISRFAQAIQATLLFHSLALRCSCISCSRSTAKTATQSLTTVPWESALPLVSGSCLQFTLSTGVLSTSSAKKIRT